MGVFSRIESLTSSVSNQDAHQVDTFVMIYDQSNLPSGPIRFKQILSRVRQRIAHYPEFQRLPSASVLPFESNRWILDERFDVEYHVRHLALPKPGDWRQFCIQVARLHSRPLDHSRPLWEINVVEGLGNIPWLGDGHFALVCKVHNSLMNSSGLQDLIWCLHDEFELPTTPKPLTGRAFGLGLFERAASLVLSPVASATSQASMVVGEKLRTVVPLVRFYTRALLGNMSVPYTRFNTEISSFRVWQSCSFSLDKVRKIQAHYPQASQEDWLLALISGALRLYLNKTGELSDRELTAIAPCYLSSPMVSSKGFSLDCFKLATQCDDPEQRIRLISKRRQEAEQRATAARWSIDRQLPPSPMQSMALSTQLMQQAQKEQGGMPAANTALVNVPSAAQSLSLLKAPLVYFSGVAEIADGLGLVHLVTRSNQRVNLSVTSCREMLPDPEFYGNCLEQSFAELQSLEPAVLPSLEAAKESDDV